VFCFDLNGRRLTKMPLDLGSAIATQPAYVGKYLLIATENGSLNLVDPAVEPGIDPATGREKSIVWSYLIRPINANLKYSSGGSGSGGLGGRGGGLGGGGLGGGTMGGGGGRSGGGLGGGSLGGSGGGKGGGGLGGNRMGGSGSEGVKVIAVPASGKAVVSGTMLLVLAQDGSLLAFDKTLGVDLTGPEVSMVWPRQGEEVCGRPPLEIIFKIVDDACGINESGIKIDVDGAPFNFNFGRDGFAICKISTLSDAGRQAFDKTKTNKPLRDGRKTITVTATDYLGNVTKKTFVLFIDNTLPPLQRGEEDKDNTGIGGKGGPGGMGGIGLGG